MSVRAWVGIGANLGDAPATVREAIERLHALGPVVASPLYRSAPIDASGPDFINAVAALDTAFEPEALLAALQAIEADFGRERPYRHAPRTLDLDLLLHGDTVWATPTLTLPHPRLHLRAFVLRPLLDLAPGLHAPGLGRLADHLAATQGQSLVVL
ncbi:2-amino-4-hydroxy-6-hydroxymethyldihydropteridine diphosphokinase [Ideonella sp. A 288]|uniref:2-amino-4-hydroxy-6- hydroxymethyldihydropteridine diphosphokinase n=1 Tax=Ideonella sp. A 288 TaxID=1962181 RepID=UPI000B4BA6AA|nr:2-amino-4-hydroxy-6-hydroxymethyldihydropteridine diphosphokinase [Ideonella sp. A 288]